MRWRDALWLFRRAALTQLRSMRGSPVILVIGVAQPVIYLTIAVRGREAAGLASDAGLAVAVALTSVWTSTVWAAGGILRRDRGDGTLAANVLTVRSPTLVLLGKSTGAILYNGALILPVTAIAAAVLGVPLSVRQPLWLLAGLVGVVVSAAALGFLIACLFVRTRYGTAWSSALVYPVLITGNLLIPSERLPPVLRYVAELIPLSHAARIAEAGLTGAVPVGAMLACAGLAAGYLLAGQVYLARIIRAAVRAGTLDLT